LSFPASSERSLSRKHFATDASPDVLLGLYFVPHLCSWDDCLAPSNLWLRRRL
jgi:hypothetical protein